MKVLRLAVCVAGGLLLLVVLPVVYRSPDATFGGASPFLLAAEAGAACALLVISAVGPLRWGAVLVGVVGAGWLLPEVAGGFGVPLWARSAADATVPLLVALLVIGLSAGTARADRWVVGPMALSVAGAVVAIAARLLLVDPFDEVTCWRTCEHNVLQLVDAGPAGRLVMVTALLGMLAGALGMWVTSGWGPVGSDPSRPASPADHVGWLVVLLLVSSLLVEQLLERPGSSQGLRRGVFLACQVAVIIWLTAVGGRSWNRWRRQRRLIAMVDAIGDGSHPHALLDALRRALQDPGLRLWFWAPARAGFVDAAGHVVPQVAPHKEERTTTVARRGRTVAVMVHSQRLDAAQVQRALRPPLRLALENQQLRAAALAELAELTSSRTQVVERTQAERRRLERNLHDGAQQRAFSLAMLVQAWAEHCREVDREPAARARSRTQALLDELRRVAHGIYPTVLADAGVGSAVCDLAERSDRLAVVVEHVPSGRFTAPVEATAYLVVRAGLADAGERGATRATVSGTHGDGLLRFCVEDDGSPAPSRVDSELSDQVGALGGVLAVDTVSGLRRLEVVLPCES